MTEDNTQGNSSGMPADAEQGMFDSSGDNFFDALEQDVNSMVQDETPVT